MTPSPDRLFELLPVVHRQRDAELGHPLKALLQVIAEQVDVVEADIERLYENWFIETCDDWVVPYLGELIGYRAVHDAGEPGLASAGERRLHKILVPRREVANTLRNRRRRGTLAMLELLAHDVAGWPARAVEFYRLLAWMQPLNHQRLARGRTVDLRDGDALDLVDGPFDSLAHSIDVRRLGSGRTRGRYNIPSVGLFVWRLRAYPISRSPAHCLDASGGQHYTFSVLGNDAPLFTRPDAEPSPHHIAGPLHVPTPIRRRALERDLDEHRQAREQGANAHLGYYGPGRSFAIWADGWAGNPADEPLPPEAIVVADLTGWTYRPRRGSVAVDPVLGRIAFPPRQQPRQGVWVSYHYGFSDDTGGGEYRRTLSQPRGAVVFRVGEGLELTRLADAIGRWEEEQPDHAVIEIADSGVYVEQVNLELKEGQTLQIRAAERTRPVIRLMDWQTARPDALWVRGAERSRFTLDGVLVTGRSVHCEGLAEVTIRHCTLVPGWSIGSSCEPRRPAEPSLELTDTCGHVTIERSILGTIQVSKDEVGTDPVRIRISDSILDATSPDREAIGAPSWPLAHAILTVERSTVVGTVETHAIELAENSIFLGTVRVARRQLGCMRFCYVAPGSRTPRRYRCQPDLAEEAEREAMFRTDVGATAHGCFVVAGAGTGPAPPCPPGRQGASLQLALEVDPPTPELGDDVSVTLSVLNRGRLDAQDLRITLTGPPEGCLEAAGEFDDHVEADPGEAEPVGDEAVIWRVGSLGSGDSAKLELNGLTVRDTGNACAPVGVITATVTAHTLEAGGAEILADRIRQARQRVRPRFGSLRYGTPTYAQLALDCDPAITRGADDESEMGAFHDLFQPQRTDNLAARLDEFVPARTDAGIIFAT